jgi:hypothetical protein
MNQELGPLLVELYLEDAHVLGVCRQVQERKRLIDVLNHQDSHLEIEQARVTLGLRGGARHYDSLNITKSAILVAVPRETQEQSRRRAVFTNMMGRQETARKSLALIVPPLALEGAAHIVASGAGVLRGMEAFSKYFPLTGATLFAPGVPDRELDVVIVSRDRVVGMSLLAAPRLANAV